MFIVKIHLIKMMDLLFLSLLNFQFHTSRHNLFLINFFFLAVLVQFRETPRFSTRRRDSVASAAMYALYRSRSDPRINHILISPSSSTQSFSHLHNSQTTTDSYSGSRGTDSPCSMSLSSSSSGPGEFLMR